MTRTSGSVGVPARRKYLSAAVCSSARARSPKNELSAGSSYLAEVEQPRRLEAAAPPARLDRGRAMPCGAQALAGRPGLLAARRGEVALGRAVVEAEPGRIARAGRQRMADQRAARPYASLEQVRLVRGQGERRLATAPDQRADEEAVRQQAATCNRFRAAVFPAVYVTNRRGALGSRQSVVAFVTRAGAAPSVHSSCPL